MVELMVPWLPTLLLQAVRNLDDLETMSVPVKYRQIMTFYKYYKGERQAPIPTLFSECNTPTAQAKEATALPIVLLYSVMVNHQCVRGSWVTPQQQAQVQVRVRGLISSLLVEKSFNSFASTCRGVQGGGSGLVQCRSGSCSSAQQLQLIRDHQERVRGGGGGEKPPLAKPHFPSHFVIHCRPCASVTGGWLTFMQPLLNSGAR
jgi:hypothetical protein